MKNFAIISLSFYIFLILFLPKNEIYYTFEKQLKTFNISLTDETFENNGYNLVVNDAQLRWEGNSIGIVENIKLNPFMFWNSFEVSNITLTPDMASFLPRKIESFSFTQHIFSPTLLKFKANGDFGKLDGFFDAKEKRMFVSIELSSNSTAKYKLLLSEFKYNDGKWVYDEILK
mgnify:CR=1 FL=1